MRGHLLAFLLALTAPAAASAQLACTLSVSQVQFDAIATTGAGTSDARGTITVNCTGSQGALIAACVDIGQGAAMSASGQRSLSHPNGKGAVAMQIFQDATLARPWGTAHRGRPHCCNARAMAPCPPPFTFEPTSRKEASPDHIPGSSPSRCDMALSQDHSRIATR